jgi:hypothetical protein
VFKDNKFWLGLLLLITLLVLLAGILGPLLKKIGFVSY